MMIPKSQRGFPTFVLEAERDSYINRLISNGFRVRKVEIGLDPVMFGVAEIDERRGPLAVE